MKTARLTLDGQPVVSEYRERRIRRRKADVEIYESKREHQLTANALIVAIEMIERGSQCPELIQELKDAAKRAEDKSR